MRNTMTISRHKKIDCKVKCSTANLSGLNHVNPGVTLRPIKATGKGKEVVYTEYITLRSYSFSTKFSRRLKVGWS